MTEVPAGASGRHHVVETDASGRITRTAVIRDGQQVSQRVYTFAPDGKAASEYDTFTGSEKTGRVRIQRNAGGERTREDYFTVSGAATGYTALFLPCRFGRSDVLYRRREEGRR